MAEPEWTQVSLHDRSGLVSVVVLAVPSGLLCGGADVAVFMGDWLQLAFLFLFPSMWYESYLIPEWFLVPRLLLCLSGGWILSRMPWTNAR